MFHVRVRLNKRVDDFKKVNKLTLSSTDDLFFPLSSSTGASTISLYAIAGGRLKDIQYYAWQRD